MLTFDSRGEHFLWMEDEENKSITLQYFITENMMTISLLWSFFCFCVCASVHTLCSRACVRASVRVLARVCRARCSFCFNINYITRIGLYLVLKIGYIRLPPSSPSLSLSLSRAHLFTKIRRGYMEAVQSHV